MKTMFGTNTNIPFHGNHIRANSSAVPPSTTTSNAEKITPATHFENSIRNREIGRLRIIRKVPSSASLATKSPPTSAAYRGMSRRICGNNMTSATVRAEIYCDAR